MQNKNIRMLHVEVKTHHLFVEVMIRMGLNINSNIMKTKQLNFVMPLVAMMLAIGGAFALDTAEMEKDAFAPELGYIDSPSPCKVDVKCDNQLSAFICTDINEVQAFGIDPITKQCTRELYRPL
ncbi:MAG TPA: DUF6520 family protein [Arenibacter sp.]|nr:DUF6520 family protein [Arenibacter sp.]